MSLQYPSISLIYLAGGRGLRMNRDGAVPKQFLPLRGKPMALHSFETMLAYPCIEEIVVVCDPCYFALFTAPPGIDLLRAEPGELRQHSVFNALQFISTQAHLVCIHDSARPLLSYEDFVQVILAADRHGAATLAAPVKNTIKERDAEGFVTRTLERAKLWEIYTPQVMRPSLLTQGFAIAKENKISVTDDVSLVELTGHPVQLVHGSILNIKVTVPEDLALADALIDNKALP
jgi:2-C-methyl-D-erythritol 4-phosphate cytidylyltransferase